LPHQVPRTVEAIAAALSALLLLFAAAPAALAANSTQVARGAYLADAADCAACHTDGKHHGQPYAGGRAIATPFGTFYSPNITPDRDTGIGRWTEAQFRRALHEGVRPDGANLFPVFPYPSFTKITDADVRALWAYLRTLPPVRRRNRPPDVPFPIAWRPLQTVWKWLFFAPGRFRPVPGLGAEQNRGAYLVTALAHCGECHTPRNLFGAMETDRFLAGTAHGPDGKFVPNITPNSTGGIGKWSVADIVTLLTDGMKPDFDFVGGLMGEVVDSTSRLTAADRRAIAVYLKSVPAQPAPSGK
jgi:mono/diheme cytochrome c family protein